MTPARLGSSSLGAAPRSSAGAWRWMCSGLDCSNVTGDTFAPGCLNQWGQPVPGGVEPHWDRPTLRRDRAAWPGEETWVDPGHGWKGSARSPAITPSPCCCCKS